MSYPCRLTEWTQQQHITTHGPLTNVQVEILKLYSFDLSEPELLDLKQVLAWHFAKRLTKRVDAIWQEKAYTVEDMTRWLNEENQFDRV